MRLSNRIVLILAVTLPLVAAAPPPVAPNEPVTDDYYGTRVVDPYRWMESGKDPRWMPWLQAQAGYTDQVMASIPGRAALLRDIQALSGEQQAVSMVRAVKDRTFIQRRDKGAEDPRLYLRDASGNERLLLDPATILGTPQAFDWWQPSPDGRFVALGLSKRGSEASVTRVLDVASGKLLADAIPWTDYGVVSWLPDSSGFTYLAFVGEHGTPTYYLNNQLRLHRLGAAGADPLLLSRDKPPFPLKPEQFTFLAFNDLSPLAMLAVSDGRRELATYVTDKAALIAGKAQWRLVGDFDQQLENGGLLGDQVWLVSTRGASNGRLLVTSGAAPDLATARTIPLPGNPVIQGLWNVPQGSLVQTVEGSQTGIWRVSSNGQATRVELPFAGNAQILSTSREDGSAYIGMTGWLHAADIYRMAPDGTLTSMRMSAAPADYDASRYETRVRTATARDGTKVPYTVVARKGAFDRGPAPLLIEAYGSYGAAMLPRFQTALIPFLDRGGAYAMANVRGGGEFGRDWHYAGRGPTKANTWQDAIDVAETLVRDRLTTPKQMTIIGTSAGGIMVGQAVNTRPDLFAGAIANVGFMNPVRYVSEQNMTDIPEWGGPITDAKTFRTMFDMDPYEHVKAGTRYPATLVISGLNDPRAATFHSAKYAARMAAATSSGQPVLLRLDFGAGHGVGSTRTQRDRLWADVYSFALWRAGVPDFQPRP
ncbi:S9 family peptidase [Sphingomonas ginkgonis]|uniref:prolyl oligopeptidase n=1 Tax=Sphingomonas ginkgonis TaxID=2315330 RepID=A0A3R9Y417_9SPHN|nr:prolyl oligopeptidase family serine peptidase [Sphingomonas ginkgonis]RST29717.1 S9 family peptidase [Sphingomonas ginkgonis]